MHRCLGRRRTLEFDLTVVAVLEPFLEVEVEGLGAPLGEEGLAPPGFSRCVAALEDPSSRPRALGQRVGSDRPTGIARRRPYHRIGKYQPLEEIAPLCRGHQHGRAAKGVSETEGDTSDALLGSQRALATAARSRPKASHR